MENQVQISYLGFPITFELNGKTMVNVTDFAKAFPEKNLSHIVNSQEITDYIRALAEIQNVSSVDLLIVKKGGNLFNNQGTWAESKVALRIAQKLSPKFAVWVDMQIEELIKKGTVSLVPKTFAEALQLAADQAKKIELQNQEIKELTPKAQIYDKISDCTNLKSMGEVAKVLGFGRNTIFEILRKRHILMENNLPYQTYINSGYFEVKTKPIPGLTKDQSTTWVTPKGELWMAKLLNIPVLVLT